MTLVSPYFEKPQSEWPSITKKLVEDFPIEMSILVDTTLQAWDDIYSSSFGNTDIKIGTDIFLPAQAIGVILEKLISVRLHNLDTDWRGGTKKNEKDIVYDTDETFSFEIKTSSSKSGLYGNRSTGYRSESRTKIRSGYYLVINYKLPKEEDSSHKIVGIRFGWIDDEDWVGQAKPTGQQASIGVKLARLKLITIFESM